MHMQEREQRDGVALTWHVASGTLLAKDAWWRGREYHSEENFAEPPFTTTFTNSGSELPKISDRLAHTYEQVSVIDGC